MSTPIEWTDETWNPVRGCTKISPGCKHCYAETFAERFRGVPGHAYEQGFDLRLVPEALKKPLHWTRPRRVFVDSMSDLFHKDVPDRFIAAVFAVMGACSQHQFQVLTKRARRLPQWFHWMARQPIAPQVVLAAALAKYADGIYEWGPDVVQWPLANVWLGVSVEDQPRADERIRSLLDTPAGLRFLSLEPLLGPVDLMHISSPAGSWSCLRSTVSPGAPDPRRIDWVIVGGESGPGARPMAPEWPRSVRDQCVEAGVPFFFKQWGGRLKRQTGRELDGRTWDEMPARAA